MSAHSLSMVSLCKVTRTDTQESTRFCTELEVVTVAVAGNPLGPVDILVAPVEQKFVYSIRYYI